MWSFSAFMLWTLSGSPSKKILDDMYGFYTESLVLYSGRTSSAGYSPLKVIIVIPRRLILLDTAFSLTFTRKEILYFQDVKFPYRYTILTHLSFGFSNFLTVLECNLSIRSLIAE